MTLHIHNLNIFLGNKKLVSNINLSINPGDTCALIGQSGAGKSLIALAIMGLLPQNMRTEGSIFLETESGTIDLLTLNFSQLSALRGHKISMIFQEPLTALNPIFTVGRQLKDVIARYSSTTGFSTSQRLKELWNDVGLDESLLKHYPHQLSGGQRQRVMIAMALANNPSLLICDEPTTALDALVEREIIDLIQKLAHKNNTSVLFISHNLKVSVYIAQHISIIKEGTILEHTPVQKKENAPAITITTEYAKNLVNALKLKNHIQEKTEEKTLATIKEISKTFKKTTALENITFDIHAAQRLGIIGGSGSGKSTLLKIIAGLEKPTKGHISWNTKQKPKISMVFQDPFSSLNPRLPVGISISEPLGKHDKMRVAQVLEDVGIDPVAASRYPHEFSGGQRQRISIARAIINQPDIILADEAVSALDMSIRAQILDLLADLIIKDRCKYHTSLLFVSHDLDAIRGLCDNVIILNDGHLVESGSTSRIFTQPEHGYTAELVKSIFPSFTVEST